MSKHWNTIALVASIIGVALVMLSGTAFQINSNKIAKEAASVQGPVSDFYIAEDALQGGAYKSAWGPAYYYRGVAHFILGDHLEARQDLHLALANGLPNELRLQATENLSIVQEVIATK